jgi:hypothetical protein
MLSKQLRGEVKTHSGEGTTFELHYQLQKNTGGGSSDEKAVLDAQGEHTHR